jgi:MFS family permease
VLAPLIVSLGAKPLKVALIQTAATLPFVVLALPTGALGDIGDRRKLMLITERWMLVAALALAAFLAELVDREEFAPASDLNGI